MLRDLLQALDQQINVEVNSNFGASASVTKTNLAIHSNGSGSTGGLPLAPSPGEPAQRASEPAACCQIWLKASVPGPDSLGSKSDSSMNSHGTRYKRLSHLDPESSSVKLVKATLYLTVS